MDYFAFGLLKQISFEKPTHYAEWPLGKSGGGMEQNSTSSFTKSPTILGIPIQYDRTC